MSRLMAMSVERLNRRGGVFAIRISRRFAGIPSADRETAIHDKVLCGFATARAAPHCRAAVLQNQTPSGRTRNWQ
jgi:hypothetical protein